MWTPPTTREVALARKLATHLHLNVEERRELPGGAVRMSAIVAAIEQSLSEVPFFPPQFRPGQGLSLVIERRSDGSLWIHEQDEIGVQRFSPLRSTRVQSLTDAAQFYVSSQGSKGIEGVPIGTSIDGVPIDWGR